MTPLHTEILTGSTLVLLRIVQSEPSLVSPLLEPHYSGLAEALSQPSPTFYNKGLLFLRLLVQVQHGGLIRILDQIDVNKAGQGWRNALRGRESGHDRSTKAEAAQIVSLLVQYSLERTDTVGELARQLRREFPRQSVLLAKTVEALDLSESTE